MHRKQGLLENKIIISHKSLHLLYSCSGQLLGKACVAAALGLLYFDIDFKASAHFSLRLWRMCVKRFELVYDFIAHGSLPGVCQLNRIA